MSVFVDIVNMLEMSVFVGIVKMQDDVFVSIVYMLDECICRHCIYAR